MGFTPAHSATAGHHHQFERRRTSTYTAQAFGPYETSTSSWLDMYSSIATLVAGKAQHGYYYRAVTQRTVTQTQATLKRASRLWCNGYANGPRATRQNPANQRLNGVKTTAPIAAQGPR